MSDEQVWRRLLPGIAGVQAERGEWPRWTPCDQCAGRQEQAGDGYCAVCRGYGRVMLHDVLEPCSACPGSGQCGGCQGIGWTLIAA